MIFKEPSLRLEALKIDFLSTNTTVSVDSFSVSELTLPMILMVAEECCQYKLRECCTYSTCNDVTVLQMTLLS